MTDTGMRDHPVYEYLPEKWADVAMILCLMSFTSLAITTMTIGLLTIVQLVTGGGCL